MKRLPSSGLSGRRNFVESHRFSSLRHSRRRGEYEALRCSMRAHNVLINAVNYHRIVISPSLRGKTINHHTRKTTTTTSVTIILRLAAVKLLFSLCLSPKYRSDILFQRAISRKARFTFIRPAFTHVTLSRASGRFTFIYTNVYGGVSTYFSSRSAVISLFTLVVAAETRIIRALERNT